MKKIIQRGAEAILYLDEYQGMEVLIKERIRKGYRLPELDEKIRLQRTRREDSLLSRAKRSGVAVPDVLNTQNSKIVMGFIDGKRVKDTLNDLDKAKRVYVYQLIGESVGKLHSSDIIHGDLTTSNMILKDERLFLIDFGLGKVSGKVEDKAVDLFLLREALKSTHFRVSEEAWENILKAYKQNYSKANEVFKRLEKIEKRRRYKG